MIKTLGKVDEIVLAEIEEEKRIRHTKEVFLLFSLGSQFDHLIKQMLEKIGVFCLVADSAKTRSEDVEKINPKGIILSGGPVSVYQNPPPFDETIFDIGIPILGICLGFQLWAQHIGCKVEKSGKREFGTYECIVQSFNSLFLDCPQTMPVLQSHGDKITLTIPGFKLLASTDDAFYSAGRYRRLWGVQFHPEVTETIHGQQIFENFCFLICGAKDKFPAQNVAEQKIAELRQIIGSKKVLLALSGGSDSSTVAHLLKNATPGKKQLRGVYIKGVDRPDDEAHVLEFFGNQDWIDLKVVDATADFLQALTGILDSRAKRIAVRVVYKAVLECEAAAFGADFIAQGTLYTDISESGGGYESGAEKAQIKIHHNVDLGFSRPEICPLADQVKDTGRNIGRALGVPEALLIRHPFPGPGLVVRVEGAITVDKLMIAKQLDEIFVEELRRADLYRTVWQAGVWLSASTTTCTKGDDKATGMVAIPWAVWSVNGFTAQAAELPWDLMKVLSRRMANEIREVGCVCFRTSDKPPATIEWQ